MVFCSQILLRQWTIGKIATLNETEVRIVRELAGGMEAIALAKRMGFFQTIKSLKKSPGESSIDVFNIGDPI